MSAITKTEYLAAGKVVLESEQTGIMISVEYYDTLTRAGMSDERIFEELRVV